MLRDKTIPSAFQMSPKLQGSMLSKFVLILIHGVYSYNKSLPPIRY